MDLRYQEYKLLPEVGWDVDAGENPSRPAGLSYDEGLSIQRQICGAPAVLIGHVEDRRGYSRHVVAGGWPSVNMSGHKASGSTRHVIPGEFAHMQQVADTIARYEARHTAIFRERNGHFEFRQRFLQAGESQQAMSWHTDNGDLRQCFNKMITDHIYIVCDHEPTLLQARPLADAFNMLSGLTRPDNDRCIQAEPYGIYLLNNYCWHFSPAAQTPGLRTFTRMTYYAPDAGKTDGLSMRQRDYLGLGWGGLHRLAAALRSFP